MATTSTSKSTHASDLIRLRYDFTFSIIFDLINLTVYTLKGEVDFPLVFYFLNLFIFNWKIIAL